MKRLRIIANSWQPTDAATPPRTTKTPPTYQSPRRSPATPKEVANGFWEEQRAASTRGEKKKEGDGDVMQTPVIDRMLSSDRLIKLRENLNNITQTPVRTLLPGMKTTLTVYIHMCTL